MPGKKNDFGQAACDLFTDAWADIAEKNNPKFGAFKAWGPTTIHPSTDIMHQHNLNHLESQLQAAANKAWKAFASEPKVTFATVTVGFPAVDKYCSAALSAVKAAEHVVIAPTRGCDFYPNELLPKTAFKFEPYFDNQHKWEIFKIADGAKIPIETLDKDKKAAYPGESLVCEFDGVPIFQLNSIDLGAKQKLYTTNINGIEVTTYGEPFKVETRYDTFHKPKTKHINDYLNVKSPLGRTNKQHKLIMDMNKKKKR